MIRKNRSSGTQQRAQKFSPARDSGDRFDCVERTNCHVRKSSPSLTFYRNCPAYSQIMCRYLPSSAQFTPFPIHPACLVSGQYKPKESLPNMRQNSEEIQNLVQLRQFVSRTLCQINDFEEGIFQVTERVLLKCGECCGILFCLHGPRSVRLTAVWETITNSINFYDSTGEKIQKTVLPLPVAIKE